MSNRNNNGSQYQNHQRAAEMHNLAAHAHRTAAEHHGQQDHLKGQEHSRQALEHSERAFLHSGEVHAALGHQRTAALAHELWKTRGCPEGSPDEDWFRANNQLQVERT
jgi:hypothetical protein